jgi:antirestriction protein ArdC
MQSQAEIRASLTQKFVDALSRGVIPWRRVWRNTADPVRLPTNFTTHRQYQGLNIPLLWLAQQEKGYPAGFWASFQQWRAAGASVRKGERGTTIVFWRKVTKNGRDENGDETKETFPLLRTWSVFNIAQVEGKVAEEFQISSQSHGTRFEDVDRTEFDHAIAATKAEVRFGGNQPMYCRPPKDYIVMPHEHQFENFPAYAEVLAHEILHWSEWRTGWKGSYPEGELRSEIGSCFLTSALGIPVSEDLSNHQAYVQSWIKSLSDDPKFIFAAASAASKGVEFVLKFSRPNMEEEAGELADVA